MHIYAIKNNFQKLRKIIAEYKNALPLPRSSENGRDFKTKDQKNYTYKRRKT